MAFGKNKGKDRHELTLSDIFPWMKEYPTEEGEPDEGIDTECPRCGAARLITENTPFCQSCDEATAY